MTELFDEEDLIEDVFNPDDKIVLDDKADTDGSETMVLDARRRLEKVLEAKRLREELDDFVDY